MNTTTIKDTLLLAMQLGALFVALLAGLFIVTILGVVTPIVAAVFVGLMSLGFAYAVWDYFDRHPITVAVTDREFSFAGY